MQELLSYSIHLLAAPNGEIITVVQRLVLLHIIIAGEGERVQVDMTRIGTALNRSPRSLRRVLSQLADLGLISLERERNELGYNAAPVAYPLPYLSRIPTANNDRKPTAISGPTAISDQPTANFDRKPTANNDRRDFDVNIGPRKDLGAGQDGPTANNDRRDSGTVLAFLSPSLLSNNIKKDIEGEGLNSNVEGLLQNEAVKVWLEVMNEDIAIEQAEYILERVTIIPLWREVLKAWVVSRWKRTNIGGQVERYQKQAKDYVPPPTAKKQPTKEEKEREERYRRIMYAIPKD